MSLYLEIGPGRGDFVMALAKENPNDQFVAVEYKLKRTQKLQKRIEKSGISNITLYCGDARKVLNPEADPPSPIKDKSVHRLYVLFSDPWPKRRHAPHRLFRQDFLDMMDRVLEPGGELYVAHDDPNYLKEIKTLFRKNATRFIEQGPWDIQTMTFYGEKWLKEGRTLEFFWYRKIDTSSQDHLALPCLISETHQ
ncbi:MAG: methyltransferase domain-containing protein [Deltaproteobacteria bacterium]|nr:MAG: methyltransferase domain-containing protein [Deltaproteobacteria bacterium]